MPPCSASVLKGCLLALWAAWQTVVFTTNLLDAGKALGFLNQSWPFASGNWRFMLETTARYGTPTWLSAILFSGVIFWEGLTALLFWLAFFKYRSGAAEAKRIVHAAFTVGLMLWGAFMIADEVFIAYAVEGTHLRLLIAQLATLLAIELLPEESR